MFLTLPLCYNIMAWKQKGFILCEACIDIHCACSGGYFDRLTKWSRVDCVQKSKATSNFKPWWPWDSMAEFCHKFDQRKSHSAGCCNHLCLIRRQKASKVTYSFLCFVFDLGLSTNIASLACSIDSHPSFMKNRLPLCSYMLYNSFIFVTYSFTKTFLN